MRQPEPPGVRVPAQPRRPPPQPPKRLTATSTANRPIGTQAPIPVRPMAYPITCRTASRHLLEPRTMFHVDVVGRPTGTCRCEHGTVCLLGRRCLPM
jgi:hypothetical protein